MIKRFCFGSLLAQTPLSTARPLRVVRNTPIDPSAALYAFTTTWLVEPYESPTLAEPNEIVAAEVVQRGAEWLEQRWREGGCKWKHVALARRAAGLSQAEFSLRWREHAGRATTRTATAVPIPAAARGLAYVQNHPMPGPSWAFDAITEVWFDDLASMQPRIDWFRDNVTTDELFGETLFLAVKEEVLEL